MADFTFKKGDTLPELTATLTYGPNGPPVIMTAQGAGDVVKFIMRSSKSAAAPLVVVISATATIVDGPNGKVKYTWTASDTTLVGSYDALWLITFASGKPMTVPGVGYMSIAIEDGLP